MKNTFTREEILEALAIHPCHITGMHSPEHHLNGSVCSHMMTDSADGVLALIGATQDELPRHLHGPQCGWCHRVPTQEEYREQLRRTHEWAGEDIPAELAAPALDAPCFDVPDRKVLRAVRNAKSDIEGGWKSWDSIREYLGLRRHENKHSRPLQRLVEQGKVESKILSNSTHVRIAKA